MKRNAWWMVGLGLSCLVLAFVWNRFNREDAGASGTEVVSLGEPAPVVLAPVGAEADWLDPFPETVGEPSGRAAGPPPKRVVHVPGEAAEVDDEAFDWQSLTPDTLLELSAKAVAAALDGNLRAADLLISVRANCRRLPDDERGIGRWAHRATEYYERSGGQPRGSFMFLFDARPTREENEAELRRWMGACRDLDRVLDSDMSAELARLAEQGNAAARLLFAMSPPKTLVQPGDPVSFDAQFSWEALARDYSWRNVTAGAPEGFLAFGHSYLSGLFTPRDFTMAAAFMKAAMDCGQAQLASGAIVDRYENPGSGEGYWRGPGQAESNQMVTYYEGIMAYCR